MKYSWSVLIIIGLFLNLPAYTMPKTAGLVQNYLVLGTFPVEAENAQPLLTDYLSGESGIIPFFRQEVENQKWQIIECPGGILNFKKESLVFGDFCVAYAHFFVKTPAALPVKFLVGSDDGIAVFVNGVLVHEHQISRGLEPDADIFPAALARGWNRVLCKVSNGSGDFQLRVRILAADGQAIPGLEFSAENPATQPESFETPLIPASFSLRQPGFSPELSISDEGELFAYIRGTIFILGNETIPGLQVKVSGKKIRETETSIQTSPLQRQFRARVNFSELMENTLEDSTLQLTLDWTKSNQTEILKILSADIFNLVFNPISLPIRSYKTSTSTYGTAEFKLPKLLKKAPLALVLPTEPATLKVNGQILTATTKVTRDVPYADQVIFPLKKNEKEYTIEVAFSNEETVPEFAKLVVFFPNYFLLKNAVQLSKIFPNNSFSKEQIPYSQFLKQLEDSKWKDFSQNLKQFDSLVAEFSKSLQNYDIHFVGHSHIDLAWMWPWTETVEVCRATFENALDLMEKYPEFTYAQSQAQTYVWIEKYFPDLFARIKKQIEAGRWIIVNGMWTEPDSNIPSGESFVRQILYGQRYFQQKFGVTTDVAWTPDTFGYAWTLPQIYRKAGLKYFMTTKIWWNDITRPQHHIFWWEAADGTRLLTFLPESIDSHPTPEFVLEKFTAYYDNTRQPDFMMLYGRGDHGGGPTQEKLDNINRLQQTQIFPKVEFSTPQKFFQKIEASNVELPVLKNEMYLEYHRGCYTTQAATKKFNRKMECRLETAEKFASFAPISWPKVQLDDAWQRTLFNQFHDILPGSSIPVVYKQAIASYDTAKSEVDAIIDQAIKTIAKSVDTKGWGTPFMVFNPLSWGRTGFVEIDLPKSLWGKNLRVSDADRWVVKTQALSRKKLLVELTQPESTPLPALGYRVYNIQVGRRREPKIQAAATQWKLTNQYYEITFDLKTGNIASIKDRQENREILSGPGNELQFFEDIPDRYDAWNIGYTGKEWRADPNPKFEIVEKGLLRAKIRITRTFGKSVFKQEIAVYRNRRSIEFFNEIDWHEAHVLVKSAFPVAVENDSATYEIPYGWIQRPTVAKNAADSAKYEVSAHKWIDLTDRSGGYGVSLLNDCKYGFDVKNNVMRITLLRSPKAPDPNADMGRHTFTYALYPHPGNWQTGQTVQRAHELNYPCEVYFPGTHGGTQPNSQSFVTLAENPGVLLTTVKMAEDREALVLRLVEYFGKAGPVKIDFYRPITQVREVDLMENPGQPLNFQDKTLTIEMKPFEIKSVEVRLK